MIKTFALAAFAAATLSTAAFAGEMADQCIAQLKKEGRDTSGCTCLEEKVQSDPALAEEFQALGQIADPAARYAAASDGAKAAMDSCTRK